MTNLKAFPSDRGIIVPVRWKQALGLASHLDQAQVLVIAANKAEAERMIAANAGEASAWSIARCLRLRRGTLSNADEALIEGGVASRDVPGVYAYYSAIKDCPVIQAMPGGSLPVVAHFRLAGGFAGKLYAEPVKPGSTAGETA